jgi:uncharacterized repeat protein (TIGR04076 family)
MPKVKITVLKRTFNREIADEYLGMNAGPCDLNKAGDVFISENGIKPEGFCDWAWNDMHKVVTTLVCGGTFNKHGYFKDWMNRDHMLIVSCTDGIRPLNKKLVEIYSKSI